jgi:hypothetical protein
MSDESRRDDFIRGWIDSEAPRRAPDRLVDAVRAELSVTPQDQAWAVGLRRSYLSRVALYAAAIVVIFVVGFVAAGLLSNGNIVGPPPTSAPTPTPSPSASPQPTPAGSQLPAGSNTSRQFEPGIQFTVPAGWTATYESPFYFELARPDAGYLVQGDGAVYFDSIKAYNRPLAGPPDGGTAPLEGIGTSALDLATWLSERPQLTATTPRPVAAAGLDGYTLDFSLSPAAGELCGMPCVNLLNSPDDSAYYAFGIEGPWKVRAFLLDAPGGTLMITVEDVDGSGFEAETAAAQEIIDSMSLPVASPSP